MLSFRNNLINIIRPFFQELNNTSNNEKFNIQEEKHFPFLRSLSKIQLKTLHNYEIIDKEIYITVAPKNLSESSNVNINSDEEIVKEIIKKDQLEQMQKILREKNIKTISPIKNSFNEIENMNIPIMIECIIQKSTNCFKYLLINGIEDPSTIIQSNSSKNQHLYEWDCMAIAIYYGEVEIVKILEENGFEKGNKPAHIEAAILSYRNSIVREMINKMDEKMKEEEIKEESFKKGLIESARSNNIKAAEFLLANGADIKVNDVIFQNRIPLFLINLF